MKTHGWVTVTIALVVLLAGGCAPAEPYARTRIGQPPPYVADAESGVALGGMAALESYPNSLGYTAIHAWSGLLPWGMNVSLSEALVNDTGTTEAKFAFKIGAAHALVFVPGGWRMVLEATVPSEAFENAPEGSRVRGGQFYLLASALIPQGTTATDPEDSESAAELMAEYARAFEEAGDARRTGEHIGSYAVACEYLRGLSIQMETKQEEETQAIVFTTESGDDGQSKPVRMHPYLAANGMAWRPQNEPAGRAAITYPGKPRNVPESLLRSCGLLRLGCMSSRASLTHGMDERWQNYPDNASTVWALQTTLASYIQEIASDHGGFEDVTRDGYHWTHRNDAGLVYSVRNLGDCVVRVEIRHDAARDPISPLIDGRLLSTDILPGQSDGNMYVSAPAVGVNFFGLKLGRID